MDQAVSQLALHQMNALRQLGSQVSFEDTTLLVDIDTLEVKRIHLTTTFEGWHAKITSDDND
eukprot:UN08566